MSGISNVQIDGSQISEILAILVTLKDEVSAVIEPRGWTSGVAVQNQVGILIGLGLGRFHCLRWEIVQVTKFRDDPRRILQVFYSSNSNLEPVTGRQARLRMPLARVGVRNRTSDGSDA